MAHESKEIDGDYEQVYFDQITGGSVLVHPGHNRGKSFGSELFVANVLARNGSTVKLLDESDKVTGKRPDADIDGEIWDFKTLTSETTAFANRVQAGIKEARKQGAIKVAYYIDRDNYDYEEVKRGIKRALDLDLSKQIQVIVVVLQNGELIIFNRSSL
jgi:hypothetical protein